MRNICFRIPKGIHMKSTNKNVNIFVSTLAIILEEKSDSADIYGKLATTYIDELKKCGILIEHFEIKEYRGCDK